MGPQLGEHSDDCTTTDHKVSSGIVPIAFAVTTLVEEPGTAIAMLLVLAISVAIDFIWKQRRATAAVA